MRKATIAAVFVGGSAAMAAAGVLGSLNWLPREAGPSAALGVALGFGAVLGGFFLLLANLDGSPNRFFGAYAAGFLVRLAALGAAGGLAAGGAAETAPVLLGVGCTVFGLLMFEGAVLLLGAREGGKSR